MLDCDVVAISKELCEVLLDRDLELYALEDGGPNNWEGYEEAMNILKEWNSED